MEGLHIGIYSCAEHEFSITEDRKCGANGFDPLYVLDDIANLRNNVDFLIVLYHGGIEFFQYPAPYLRKICRRLVEKGADIVLCQHSHCVGSFERYENGMILYGQGNFMLNMDDGYMDHSLSDYGVIVQIDFHSRNDWTFSFLPLKRYGTGVKLLEDDEKKTFLKILKQGQKNQGI